MHAPDDDPSTQAPGGDPPPGFRPMASRSGFLDLVGPLHVDDSDPRAPPRPEVAAWQPGSVAPRSERVVDRARGAPRERRHGGAGRASDPGAAHRAVRRGLGGAGVGDEGVVELVASRGRPLG